MRKSVTGKRILKGSYMELIKYRKQLDKDLRNFLSGNHYLYLHLVHAERGKRQKKNLHIKRVSRLKMYSRLTTK